MAADAVVDEQPTQLYDSDDSDHQPTVERVYNVSEVEDPSQVVVNSFSPPVETEGKVDLHVDTGI